MDKEKEEGDIQGRGGYTCRRKRRICRRRKRGGLGENGIKSMFGDLYDPTKEVVIYLTSFLTTSISLFLCAGVRAPCRVFIPPSPPLPPPPPPSNRSLVATIALVRAPARGVRRRGRGRKREREGERRGERGREVEE